MAGYYPYTYSSQLGGGARICSTSFHCLAFIGEITSKNSAD